MAAKGTEQRFLKSHKAVIRIEPVIGRLRREAEVQFYTVLVRS
jgi:hypothetical protein